MHGTINIKNFKLIFPENSRKIFASVSLIPYMCFNFSTLSACRGGQCRW